MLLIAAQDDEGRYPWSRTMVRSLCVSTDWSMDQATAIRDELANLELLAVSPDGSFVTLHRGKELNGNPKPTSRDPMVYPTAVGPVSDSSPTAVGPVSDSSPAREKRVEKRSRERREDDLGGPENASNGNGSLLSLSEKEVTDAFGATEIFLSMWNKQDCIARLKRGVPPSVFLAAINDALTHKKLSYGYVAKILDRVEAEGFGTLGGAGPGPPAKPPAQSESKPYREVFGETKEGE